MDHANSGNQAKILVVLSAMDALIIFLIAGTAMSLFLIPVIALYAALEANHREREIRRYARKKVMLRLEHEQEIEKMMKRLNQ